MTDISAAFIAAFTREGRATIAMMVNEEQAAVQLAAVVGPHGWPGIVEEVERRRDVFQKRWPTLPHSHDETPMLAALRSVYSDATYGRMS